METNDYDAYGIQIDHKIDAYFFNQGDIISPGNNITLTSSRRGTKKILIQPMLFILKYMTKTVNPSPYQHGKAHDRIIFC